MNKILLPALLLMLATGPAWATPPQSKDTPSSKEDNAALHKQFDELQQQMQQLARRMSTLALKLDADNPKVYAWRYIGEPDRGMLGLVMMPDTKGLKVVAVTPGSPAEGAGIKAGDTVVAVDGKPTTQGHDVRGPHDEARRMHVLHDLKIGQKVTLKLDHDGKSRSVQLTAQRNESADWPRVLAMRDVRLRGPDGPDVDIRRAIDNAHVQLLKMRHEDMPMFMGTPWWGLNLSSINKDLGSYFGTTRGALVLSTDKDRYPGLKAGDVITKVDGTGVDQPEDVIRALHEHKGDGPVQIALRRHGKALEIHMKAPSLDAMLPPPPPHAPVAPPTPDTPPPPAPPAPDAPPAPPPQHGG